MEDEAGTFLESLSGILIGIVTADFSLSHDMIGLSKELGLRLVHIDHERPIPEGVDCIILGPGDDNPFPPGEKTRTIRGMDNPEGSLLRGIAASLGKMKIGDLVIGVDPGKRPGLAFLADGVLVYTCRAPGLEGAAERILRAKGIYKPDRLLLRIGNGDPENRGRIIADLRDFKGPVELVDERMTSRGVRLRDENAAVAISRTRGKRLNV